MTPLSGVRSSWLMFARNSLLARVAASADSLAMPQLVFVLQPFGDVAHERAEEVAAAGAHRVGHGNLDRKLVPVAVEAAQLEPPVDDRRFAGLVKPAQAFDVRRAETGRDDRIGQLPADDVVARPAEGRRRLRVPRHDPAVGIHADEAVVRRIEHQPRARLALGEILHGLPPIGIGERDDDEIGQRQGKVLLVDLPRPWPADVLDAHHAERRDLPAAAARRASRRCRSASGTTSLNSQRSRIGVRIGRPRRPGRGRWR